MRYLYIIIIASYVAALSASAGEITFQPVPDIGKDTYVNQEQPNLNYGRQDTMYIGKVDNIINQILIQFVKLDDYIGTSIFSATLYLYFKVTYPIGETTLYMDIITEDWNQVTVTWNTKPDVAGMPVSYGYPTSTERVWEQYDVTDVVRDWLNGTYDNYGWLIYTDDYIRHMANADTSDYSEPTYRPKLVVDFDSPVESSSLGEIKAAFK